MPDGSVRRIEVRKTLLGSPPASLAIVGTLVDVTDRRRAERAAQENEAAFRALIEALPDPALLVADDYTILAANNSLAERLGMTVDGLSGRSFIEVLPPEVGERRLGQLKSVFRTGLPVVFEDSRAGRQYLNHVYPVRDVDGRVAKVAVFALDVTDRKRADDALRREQEFTETAINVMPGTFFVLTRDMRYVRWNKSQQRRVGLPPENMREMSALNLIHEDDRALVGRAVERVFKEGSAQCEARGRDNGSGELRHYLYNARRMEIGGEVYLVGTGIDITERKRAEAALAASEERYRLIATNTSDGIFTLNREGRITFVSPLWLRKGGYREDEVVGHGMIEFVAPEYHATVLANFKRSLSGEETPNYEVELLESDGARRPVELSMSSITDENGQVIGRVGVFRDITERRQAEENLTRSLDRLRTAMTGVVQVMVTAIEARDPYTAGHQRRVARLAAAIAAEMNLPPDVIDGLRYASIIHDIGKISLPAEILSKPMRLSDLEVKLVQTHAQAGYDILKDIEFPWPIAAIILQHHERLDGSGYPTGLKGNEIRVEARILGVADVVDAIASHRPYRPALGVDAALAELQLQQGVLYDPSVVQACCRLFSERAFALDEEKPSAATLTTELFHRISSH
jgi:PAS domain S-box-containing protein